MPTPYHRCPCRIASLVHPTDGVSDSTMAQILEAQYFTYGPFAHGVDRMRNNRRLWPHQNARERGGIEARLEVDIRLRRRCSVCRSRPRLGRGLKQRASRCKMVREIVEGELEDTEVQDHQGGAGRKQEITSIGAGASPNWRSMFLR